MTGLSPFPANATLVFQIPANSGEIDELGNPIANITPLTVQAYLKVSNRSKAGDRPDGGELSQIYLEGRCVDPLFLPPSLLPGAEATVEIRDLGGVMPTLSGDFILEPSIASAFGTTAALGGAIKGSLVDL